MTIKDIYKTTKPSLSKDITLEDKDLEATAWQYAFKVMKEKRITKALKNDGSAKLITPKLLKDIERYNHHFMDHYTKAIKVLRKAKQ